VFVFFCLSVFDIDFILSYVFTSRVCVCVRVRVKMSTLKVNNIWCQLWLSVYKGQFVLSYVNIIPSCISVSVPWNMLVLWWFYRLVLKKYLVLFNAWLCTVLIFCGVSRRMKPWCFPKQIASLFMSHYIQFIIAFPYSSSLQTFAAERVLLYNLTVR
jgi:hypothetical protein